MMLWMSCLFTIQSPSTTTVVCLNSMIRPPKTRSIPSMHHFNSFQLCSLAAPMSSKAANASAVTMDSTQLTISTKINCSHSSLTKGNYLTRSPPVKTTVVIRAPGVPVDPMTPVHPKVASLAAAITNQMATVGRQRLIKSILLWHYLTSSISRPTTRFLIKKRRAQKTLKRTSRMR